MMARTRVSHGETNTTPTPHPGSLSYLDARVRVGSGGGIVPLLRLLKGGLVQGVDRPIDGTREGGGG
jgi:hypothetical protein